MFTIIQFTSIRILIMSQLITGKQLHFIASLMYKYGLKDEDVWPRFGIVRDEHGYDINHISRARASEIIDWLVNEGDAQFIPKI